ncbi:C-signal-like [Ptychodera flava]|uniref:C-signal-like n=1 Tax=Ptychodera flava TaxID=63121 RepID=UPI003969E80C
MPSPSTQTIRTEVTSCTHDNLQSNASESMASLQAKTVLITGCSRGIGLELVKQFVRLPSPPAHIFASCRSPDTAHELQQISKDNPSVHVLKIDVEDKTTIENAAVQVEQILTGSGLNLLINNAGIAIKELKIDDVTEEAMLSVYRVNTIGPLLITKRFLPLIRKAAQTYGKDEYSASRAAIMNMSSKVGSIDDNRSARYYSYRCSKIALHMVSKNLSIELEADKVMVVNLHPGWVQTDMGGPNANTSTEDCVNGLMNVMATRTKEHNALFYDFKGMLIPW